jgi:hypothetical protein
MANRCIPSLISAPVIPGVQVLNLYTTPVVAYPVPQDPVPGFGVFPAANIDFCNVTVTYTHPGQNDNLNVEVWLPAEDKWNNRILAVGGGGLAAGRNVDSYTAMAGVVSEKYASFTTDGGLANPNAPADWALERTGCLNKVNLENWGTRSLDDMVSDTNISETANTAC